MSSDPYAFPPDPGAADASRAQQQVRADPPWPRTARAAAAYQAVEHGSGWQAEDDTGPTGSPTRPLPRSRPGPSRISSPLAGSCGTLADATSLTAAL